MKECIKRLLEIFITHYEEYFKKSKPEFIKLAKFILNRNILCGNALTLKDDKGKPIVFSEWSFVKGSFVKRRDFVFEEMIPKGSHELFSSHLISDEGKPVFIAEPIKEYPLTHFLNLVDAD